ncbi:MAG: NUDIX hydrolase [Croceibacterium sp.]
MTDRALPPDAEAPEVTEWSGRFVEAKRRGRWEYASRKNFVGAAVILALDAGEVILVEQYRVPLGARCLELPAGLIGDEAGTEGEDAAASAARELAEETGYAAAHWEVLGEFCSSPGMLSETFTLVKATGLTRIGDGGGVAGEDIAVHRVPLAQIAGFVRERRGAGVIADAKLLVVLGGAMLEDPAQ